MDFMHPWIKKSMKREAEMCQTQADRPRRGRTATNCQLQTDATLHRHLDKIRSIHEKGGCERRKSQAGQPGRGLPASLCSVLSSSTDPLAYT